jgi:hypothetical protein
MMNITENIEYCMAQNLFEQADKSGNKLVFGSLNTNFWLHKEKINLDVVIENAKRYTDSRIFIISEGKHKGFYIYSQIKKDCIKLITTTKSTMQPAIV